MKPTIHHEPLPERDLFGGFCWKPRPDGTVVDTIILHSTHLPASVTELNVEQLGLQGTESEWQRLATAWRRDGLADAELQSINCLVRSRCGVGELHAFSVAAQRAVFEFYGVSAHYLIDREGMIHELVPPDLMAFHAGKSQMPRPEDGRTGVNAFSIGIELMASPESGYREPQIASLAALVDSLMLRFPISNLYGHSEIAPERKSDPWQFDWSNFLLRLSTRPKFVATPSESRPHGATAPKET
jgi:hypothetical protein